MALCCVEVWEEMGFACVIAAKKDACSIVEEYFIVLNGWNCFNKSNEF